MTLHYENLYQHLKSNPQALQDKIKEDVTINEDALRTCILTQTEKYAEWGYVSSKASTEAKRAKYVFEEDVKGMCFALAEEKLKEEGRKITVKAVESEAPALMAWKEAREAYLQAQEFADVTKQITEAMRHRLSMVQSLNSRQKSEMSNY